VTVEKNLDVFEDELSEIEIDGSLISGVRTRGDSYITCDALVLSAGTFLNGRMHTGTKSREGGRFGERSSHGVTESLMTHGFTTGRLKTGTPPRIELESIDISRVELQLSDNPLFHFLTRQRESTTNLYPCI